MIIICTEKEKKILKAMAKNFGDAPESACDGIACEDCLLEGSDNCESLNYEKVTVHIVEKEIK